MLNSFKDSCKLFNSLFRSITSGVLFINADDKQIIDINPAASIMLGLDKDAVIGKPCSRFICNSMDGSCLFLDKGIDIDNQEGIIERKDGSIIIVLRNVTSIIFKNKKYLVINLIDITSCKKSELVARENEQRFRDVIHIMADCVWELNLDYKYIYCSERIIELLGYTIDEVIGKKPFDFMSEDEAKKLKTVFDDKVKNKEKISNLESWSITKGGASVCFLINGVPVFDAYGKLKCYRGVNKNITEKKLMWSELEVELSNNIEKLRISNTKEESEDNISMHDLYNALNLGESKINV